MNTAFGLLPQQLRSLDPNWFLLGGWMVGGLLAILLPVIRWNRNKNEYYQYYGQYNEYQQQQDQQDQNNNNNNNNNYGYYSRQCRWFQFKCRKQQYDYQQQYGSGDQNQEPLPSWYLFIGGQTEQDERRREEAGLSGSSDGALKFVYSLMLIIFIGIVAYGGYVIHKRQAAHGLVVVLLFWFVMSLMNLILIAQGVISTDDRDMEDSVYGWYGQVGVLMAYTDLWSMLYCLVFSIVFVIKIFLERRDRDKRTANEGEEEWDTDNVAEDPVYQIHDGTSA